MGSTTSSPDADRTTTSSTVLDARAAGLAVAGLAVWRRWPFLVVVALAALTTATFRYFVPGS